MLSEESQALTQRSGHTEEVCAACLCLRATEASCLSWPQACLVTHTSSVPLWRVIYSLEPWFSLSQQTEERLCHRLFSKREVSLLSGVTQPGKWSSQEAAALPRAWGGASAESHTVPTSQPALPPLGAPLLSAHWRSLAGAVTGACPSCRELCVLRPQDQLREVGSLRTTPPPRTCCCACVEL